MFLSHILNNPNDSIGFHGFTFLQLFTINQQKLIRYLILIIFVNSHGVARLPTGQIMQTNKNSFCWHRIFANELYHFRKCLKHHKKAQDRCPYYLMLDNFKLTIFYTWTALSHTKNRVSLAGTLPNRTETIIYILC